MVQPHGGISCCAWSRSGAKAAVSSPQPGRGISCSLERSPVLRRVSVRVSGSATTSTTVSPEPPQTVAEVIKQLKGIGSGLPETDGVRRFNDLYLAMTEAIDDKVTGGGFENPGLLFHLDVVFADRYLAAVDAAKAGKDVPSAWAPLFADRAKAGVAPIQFALAGCNAHINFDLAVALAQAWQELKVTPATDSPEHRDFLKVNTILVAVEAKMKKELDEGLVGEADKALGRLDDVVAMWSMERARDAAWTHAEVLWKLRELGGLEKDYLATLAKIVGFSSRGLLVPVL